MTPKQKRFCEEYVVDSNATQAAIRAGYSRKNAKVIGSRLLTKVDISSEINQNTKEIANKLKFKAEEVIAHLVAIAKIDPDNGITTCKFSDKNKALELLGKHFSMFSDKLSVTTDSQPQVVLYWPENGRDNKREGK
tara:strand:- start:2213 stop:2620 length:408 start_codon:yes stop_codon:yes gene_type:complete